MKKFFIKYRYIFLFFVYFYFLLKDPIIKLYYKYFKLRTLLQISFIQNKINKIYLYFVNNFFIFI